MMISIDKWENGEYGTCISASYKKKSADIIVSPDGEVNVICNNASHKAWGGFGKFFPDIDKAIDNYKSGEMKGILNCIKSELEAVSSPKNSHKHIQ